MKKDWKLITIIVLIMAVGILAMGLISKKLASDTLDKYIVSVQESKDANGDRVIKITRTVNNPAIQGEKGDQGVRGFPGKNGSDGKDGQDGDNGSNGIDGTNVTAEQIAAAVSQYLIANPPPKGDKGDTGAKGDDGNDGTDGKDGREVEFCRLPDGTYGQRYKGTTECNPIPYQQEDAQ